MRIMVINGPGAWILGREEIENSGNDSLFDIIQRVNEIAEDYDAEVEFVKTNFEGEIIESLYLAHEEFDGVILDAGGYALSSYAIAEAINAINVPVIEVCPRKNTFFADKPSIIKPFCQGSISGLGSSVYTLALEALLAP
ncbi:MAG: type II 3-dehydroquinate dehydratase [Ruminococcaceae bacterium]|nr:type II 3-dehydroquinate dehydratase [Oscillospiraceae bacterium]